MKYFKILGIGLIISTIFMVSGLSASVLGLISIKIPALGGIYTSPLTTKTNTKQQQLETVGSVDATWGTARDTSARVKWVENGTGNNTTFKAAPKGEIIYWSEAKTKVVGWYYYVQLRATTTISPTAITYNGVYNSN